MNYNYNYNCLIKFIVIGLISLNQLRESCAFKSSLVFSRSSRVISKKSEFSLRVSSETLQEDEKELALMKRVEEEVQSIAGVSLEDLINPSRVVNLTRDIQNLNEKLGSTSSDQERKQIKEKIEKKQKALYIEQRSVFRGWLKNLFVGQSVIALVISFLMVYDAIPGTHLDLSIRVLGFWMWWLFIIPSLRARKPSNEEKSALNWAFLATPLVSLALPVVTKDTAIIWWANGVAVAACYAKAYTSVPTQEVNTAPDTEETGETATEKVPSLLKSAFKALDYGSGQERGARK